jgi:uncharacterized membrane protein YgdD (TMEM256/DUF423 family)
MHKGFLQTAAILGLLAVALGAFGAHTLKQYIQEDALNTFETGVRYQFYHALALLAVGMLLEKFPNKQLRSAGYCFIWGVVLFSGSLYALTALKATSTVGLSGIGIVTPLGGVLFILGWLFLLLGVRK